MKIEGGGIETTNTGTDCKILPFLILYFAREESMWNDCAAVHFPPKWRDLKIHSETSLGLRLKPNLDLFPKNCMLQTETPPASKPQRLGSFPAPSVELGHTEGDLDAPGSYQTEGLTSF